MGGLVGNGRCIRRIKHVPLPSQRKFHLLRTRFKGFSGAIGSGKSQALCQEAIKLSYLNPGRLGLIGAPTYAMLRDATQSAFFDILRENGLPHEFNKAENMVVMKDTRSLVIFRSLDEYERLRGTNLSWFGIDELTYTAEEAWMRLEGRLRDPKAARLCGFAVWTPKGYDWVYHRFIENKKRGYAVVLAAPFENRYVLDKVPDFYERLRTSYDETFFRQEVLGEYVVSKNGRVYPEFTRADHVRQAAADPNLPLLWALDFNVNPMCSVVAQIQGDEFVVLDEIVLEHASTHDACAAFLARFGRHRAGLTIYGDASGANLRTTGTSDYDMIREFFRNSSLRHVHYSVPKKNPAVRERVMLVNARLRNAAGDVRLRVAPNCKELISDFEQVAYVPGTNNIDKDRDPRRTHLSDAVGYLVFQECRPQPPAGERSQRLL